MTTISVKHLKNVRLIGGTGADLIIDYDAKMTVSELSAKLAEVLPDLGDKKIKMLRFHPLMDHCDTLYPYWTASTTLAECAIPYNRIPGAGFWIIYILV